MKLIFHSHIPFEKLPFKILFGFMLFLSALLWVFLFSTTNPIFQKVKVVELVVSVIILIGSIVTILFIGYSETYLENLTFTYCIQIVVSILVLYITKTGLSLRPDEGGLRTLFYCLQFVGYTGISVFVTFLPSALICFIMFLIISNHN